MGLSSIGDGVFTAEGGGLWGLSNVGITTGLILPHLERLVVDLQSLLHVRIIYYTCGKFITRAVDLLRVRLIYYTCG